MQTRAAILWDQPGDWHVVDVELDRPGPGEVLVEVAASGLSRADDDIACADVQAQHLPFCGGIEGSGTVLRVGAGVSALAPGDHVITSPVPSCGRCRRCVAGRQNLCVESPKGDLPEFRMRVDGVGVAAHANLGTFSHHQVLDARSCIALPSRIPLGDAALLAHSVPTGWGAAIRGAMVRPGDVVIVMGTGAIGINAVQAARHAGARNVIAVDPLPFKREMALKLGAGAAVADIVEARELARALTDGDGADSTIIAVDGFSGNHIEQALESIRPGGTVVLTSGHRMPMTPSVPIDPMELAWSQKRIQGARYGAVSHRQLVNELVGLYLSGDLRLHELVTTRYTLDQIDRAYIDLDRGINIRGIVDFTG